MTGPAFPDRPSRENRRADHRPRGGRRRTRAFAHLLERTRVAVGTVPAPRPRVATPPRRVIPGMTVFVTHRCSERRFFLRPCRATNDIVRFALANSAKRYGVRLHAFCVLSDHMHLVLTDVEGRLPDFMRDLDSLIARAVNASLGRVEGFWSTEGYLFVEPATPSDVFAKIVYVLANPVAAGLVSRAADWPGLWCAPEQIGTTTLTACRPTRFFAEDGDLPATVDLELVVPPGFPSADEFRTELAAALRAREEEHRQTFAAQGRRFLGVAGVRGQDPFARATSYEPRFTLRPRIAARRRALRLECIRRLKLFEQQYRDARAAWCAGMRDVLFPAGTYLMRMMYGVQCAGAA